MGHSKTIEDLGKISVKDGGRLGERAVRIEEWEREKDVYYLQGAPRTCGLLKESQVWIDLSHEDREALEGKDATLTTKDGRKLHSRLHPDGELGVLDGLH